MVYALVLVARGMTLCVWWCDAVVGVFSSTRARSLDALVTVCASWWGRRDFQALLCLHF